MTSSRTTPLALALGLALTTLVGGPAQARPADGARAATSELVGEWRMTSLEVAGPTGLAEVPYSGRVIFTAGGTMSVQAMNPDPTAPDTPLTVDGYESYYGPVRVRPRKGTLTVTVRSAAVRNLIGQKFDRVWRVRGNTLVLTPQDASEGFRVTYKRVR